MSVLKDFFEDLESRKIEFVNYHFDNLTVDKDFFNRDLYRFLKRDRRIVENKIREENYDLIFAHAPTDILILKNFLERASTIFYSNIPPYVRIFPFKFIIKKYLERLNCVICVSEFIKRNVENIIPSKKNVYIVYNGIEPVSSRSDPPDSIKNIGVVARLEREKNVALAIRTFKVLNRKYDYLSLHLFGDGSEKKKLEKLALRYGMKNVYFHGFVKDIDGIYSTIDLLVVPSRMEAFSLVIIEAMSKNIPVVASNVGGIPEIIKDGYNGLLAEPNVKSFVIQITKIIENPELINTFTKNYVQTLEKFNINKKFEDLYKIFFDQTWVMEGFK
jgi:glycosyltransferase involved in cell wall biosynthesis